MSENNVYVGIDLHKRNFNYVMIPEKDGNMSCGKGKTTRLDVMEFASKLTANHHVTLEPVENWYWFIKLIRPFAGSVELANPYKLRLIAESKSKSDHVDAMILAKLIKAGFLPKSYIPSDETMTWRDMSHHRHCLVKDRTRLKNRVSSSINREGFQISVSDLFGKKGREEIDSLDLSAAARDKINDDLVCIDLLTLQLEKLDQRIMEISESDEVITLLRTIDGIGHILGFTIKAIVGEMFRFKSEKAFANYSGLVPSHRQSGKTTRTGPITKRGPNLLRWALIQAVPHAVRKSDYLKRKYNRIIYKSSCGKAKVAAAHDLAKIVYHVWTEARPYYR